MANKMPRFEDFPDEFNAVQQKLKDELVATKGIFWARKVLYIAGLKHIAASIDDQFPMIAKSFRSIMVGDVVNDLQDHYPDRDLDEMLQEFVADCKRTEDIVLNVATDVWNKVNPDDPKGDEKKHREPPEWAKKMVDEIREEMKNQG